MHICNWAPPDGIRMALPRLDWSTYTYRMHIMHDMRACMQHAAAMLATESPAAACAQCMGKNKAGHMHIRSSDAMHRRLVFCFGSKNWGSKTAKPGSNFDFRPNSELPTSRLRWPCGPTSSSMAPTGPRQTRRSSRRSSRRRGSTTVSCSRRPAPIGKWKAAIGVWRRQAAHRPQLARSANVDA